MPVAQRPPVPSLFSFLSMLTFQSLVNSLSNNFRLTNVPSCIKHRSYRERERGQTDWKGTHITYNLFPINILAEVEADMDTCKRNVLSAKSCLTCKNDITTYAM